MSEEIVLRIPVSILHDLIRSAEPARQSGGGHPDHSRRQAPRPWTEKQRRLLLRLVYRLGHEGGAARRFIAEQLGLRDDEQPTIQQASSLIDRLKNSEDHRGAA